MIYVLLPAFNEEISLPRLLPKIHDALTRAGHSYQLIIGDDGSRDRTPQVLEELTRTYPIEVVRHRINRGLGETSRDLFERASERAAASDVIIRLDCDDTHDPEVMPKMVARLDEGLDVVIASRFQPGGGQVGVEAHRAFISRMANLFMKFFFPIAGVYEYSCGYRAYRAAVIQRAIAHYGNNFIQLKGLGFTCTLEKLVKLKLLGARIGEVGFVLRYDRKESTSKMVTSVTTLGYLVMAVLYHWPWGGWRTAMDQRRRDGRMVPESSVDSYSSTGEHAVPSVEPLTPPASGDSRTSVG